MTRLLTASELPYRETGPVSTLLLSDDQLYRSSVRRVLIIDDDAAIRQVLERMLRVDGIDVSTSTTGEEGIERAKSFDYDVILIDLRLSDMTGVEVIEALRDVCSARLILMSAFLSTHVTVDAMKRGAFDVLEKPMNIETLLDAVRAAPSVSPSRFTAPPPSETRLITAPRSVVERWVGYVIKACDATSADSNGDFKTLAEWARLVGVSYSTLCETCRLLGLQPIDARDFARVLIALKGAVACGCAPEVLLNVSSRRVLTALSSKAGIDLERKAEALVALEFFANQQFIPRESEALRLVRLLRSGWFIGNNHRRPDSTRSFKSPA